MHRLPARALAAVALALLATTPSFAQVWKGKGRLQGEVNDEAGKPVAGVKVTLRMQDNPEAGPEPVVSDKHGKWSALGLVNAGWTVKLEAEGYDISQGIVKVNEYGSNPVVKTTMYKASAAADPRIAEAQAALDRGSELLKEKKATEARLEFEKALPVVEGANRLLLLKRIAFCQMVEGNDAGAVDTLKTVLAESPDDQEALRLIVDRLVVLHRNEEAQPYMAKLGTGGVDPNTLLNIGITAYNENKLEEAQAKFDEAITAKPDWADPYYYRGLALLAQGKSAEAKADFEKLLALDPNHQFANDCREFLKSL